MKLDEDYSFIYVCPKTKEELSNHEVFYSHGVCPRCGHNDNSTITHYDKVVGRYNRPSMLERLQGKKTEFLTKEEEDKVWNTLKN